MDVSHQPPCASSAKARRSASARGRPSARSVAVLRGPATRLQRSTVKASYARNRRGVSWGAHGVYLAREGAQREDERGVGFDAERDDVDLATTLHGWQAAGDERLWKFVVSPEHGASLDLREHALRVIADGRARTVHYELRGPDELLWGLGLGCEGAMRILLLRVSAANDAAPIPPRKDRRFTEDSPGRF